MYSNFKFTFVCLYLLKQKKKLESNLYENHSSLRLASNGWNIKQQKFVYLFFLVFNLKVARSKIKN